MKYFTSIKNKTIVNCTCSEANCVVWNFTGTWRNNRYENCTFQNISVHNVAMSHVHFINCSLYNVTFQKVTSSRVVFTNSRLYGCSFIDSDLLALAQLDNTTIVEKNVIGLSLTCRVELDFDLRVFNYNDIAYFNPA
ncbi:Uncharacterized protein GBIM_18215, partial [Gryllus bimaculatus]